jgi:hypothetical protein
MLHEKSSLPFDDPQSVLRLEAGRIPAAKIVMAAIDLGNL